MNSMTQNFGRKLVRSSAIAITLACSACATMPQTARTNPRDNGTFQALYQQPAASNVGQAKASRRSQAAANAAQQAAVPAVGVHNTYRDPAFQQIAHFEQQPVADAGLVGSNAGVVQQAGRRANAQDCPDPSCPGVIYPCPPVPRYPAAGPNPMAMGMMACDVCNMPNPETYTDEYLCDGGDRDWPVHYDSFSRVSLDTEDTVLEFTDKLGNERVKPSNKVCIYAPRFASVRTVSQAFEGSKSNEAAGIEQLASIQRLHTRLKSSQEMKRESAGGVAVRARSSGMASDSYQDTVSQRRGPSVHEKLDNVYESFAFLKTGRIDDADCARLNYGIQAAWAWSRDENPVIEVKVDMAVEGHYEQAAASMTFIEDRDEAENLRIVKLADKQTALPGDEVTFTIRYDNLGGREVFHVRIVDNLTPRLDYVSDSATSDRDGHLTLQDNGEGSHVLVWEFDEPLPARTGGVVTFKARVR